jgi:hypothetical protein
MVPGHGGVTVHTQVGSGNMQAQHHASAAQRSTWGSGISSTVCSTSIKHSNCQPSSLPSITGTWQDNQGKAFDNTTGASEVYA